MGYTIKSIEIENDQDAIVTLWKNNFPSVFPNRFQWIYENNPFGPTRTFVAKHGKTGEIVGAGSVYAHHIHVNGQTIPFGVACDFIVDPNHRVFGPALKIERAVGALVGNPGLDFIFAFPNKDSRAIFLRVGFKPMGKVRNYVKLVKTGDKLAKYLKTGIIAKPAGMFLDSLFLMTDVMRSFLKPRDFAFETRNSFDGRFDTLWEKAKGHFPISGEKSSAYLNWRYAECRNQEYRIFCLKSKTTNEILGYAVYYVVEKLAFVADIFIEKQTSHLHYLILGLSRHLRKYDIGSISFTYMGDDTTDKVLRKLFFFERECDRECMLLFKKNSMPDYGDLLFDENNWFIFEGEMDL